MEKMSGPSGLNGVLRSMCWEQARLFVAAGVTKVRLTGGEPTLRRDLVELTEQLAALPGLRSIGLTTNGLTLASKLAALKAAGALPAALSVPHCKLQRSAVCCCGSLQDLNSSFLPQPPGGLLRRGLHSCSCKETRWEHSHMQA